MSNIFCSKIHNLSHLIDAVGRFGPLDTFDAYPLESKLYYLKRLIHSGNMPLSQIAKRIREINLMFPLKKFNNQIKKNFE